MRSPKAHIRQIKVLKCTVQDLPQSRQYHTIHQDLSLHQQNNHALQHIQPQQQLISQLKQQIRQLLPLKSSISNLLHCYQLIKTNYEDLLHHMNQKQHLKSHAYLNSDQHSLLSQTLREYEIQYEEMSDYMNLHLIDKLNKEKTNNANYCQKLTAMEKQLNQLKSQTKTNHLQTQFLTNQYHKLLQQLAVLQHASKQKKQLFQALTIKSQHYKTQQIQKNYNLNELKSHQSLQHQKQSQLLNQLLQQRKLNHQLTSDQKKSSVQLQISQSLQYELIVCNQSAKDKLISIQTTKSFTYQSYLSDSAQTQLLQEEIARLEQLNIINQQQINQINQNDIPQIILQSQTLKQQHLKSTQFLTYLRTYEKQLKSTSNLMFQQLNQCCKQDYEKLLKVSSNNLNQRIPTLVPNSNNLNSSTISNPHPKPYYSQKKKVIRDTYINQLEQLDEKENFQLQKKLYFMRHQQNSLHV